MKPFFSIVIPTYNCADFIRQTVTMVEQQSFPDWELIIVDDGSTDETWVILEELLRKVSKLKVFQRPEDRTKGPSACRNIGVENLIGQYIAFLDADDEWAVLRLENAFNFIQETKAKAIYSGAWVIDQKGKYFRESRAIHQDESFFDFSINGDSFAQTSTLIVSAEKAKQVAFPENIRFHEDFAYFVEVGTLTDWLFFPSQDVLVHWEDNHVKKVNYEDCLWFYMRYRHLSKNQNVRINYLKYTAHEVATRQPKDQYLKTYRQFLNKEGVKLNALELILFNTPFLYFFLWRLRSNFKNDKSIKNLVMFKLLLNVFSILGYVRCFPHLIFWKFSKNKKIIDYEIKKWADFKGLKKDLNKNFFYILLEYPEFRNLFYYRIGKWSILINFLCRKLSTLYLFTPEIGPGMYIQHGFATIVAAKKIGKDCFINQQVTIGYTESDKTPILGDNVRVGAGAKVLGDIHVGNHVKIGANAVVIKDVPDNCTVVGVPAQIVKRDGKKVPIH